MTEQIKNCKCGAAFIINSQYVSFNGGRVAYIKCSECPNKQRIKYDLVKHLKEESPEEEADGLNPEPEGKPEDDEDVLKALNPEHQEKEAEALNQDQEEGNGVGWALAAVTGLAGLFLIAAGLKRG
ncbi:MAG: hypothetical protein KAJ18_03465 [Candidatus Omnitrophica bacterium]|nr:hypothetical protein [Candidatus Omnitrophota bacterium]